MVLLSFLEIFIIVKVTKNVPKLSVQVWRSLWSIQQFFWEIIFKPRTAPGLVKLKCIWHSNRNLIELSSSWRQASSSSWSKFHCPFYVIFQLISYLKLKYQIKIIEKVHKTFKSSSWLILNSFKAFGVKKIKSAKYPLFNTKFLFFLRS